MRFNGNDKTYVSKRRLFMNIVNLGCNRGRHTMGYRKKLIRYVPCKGLSGQKLGFPQPFQIVWQQKWWKARERF